MIILGRIIEVKDENKFCITWHHRVPVGLQLNTTVYLVLLPKPEESPHNMPEVILTPIDPWSWGDLWQIKCRFIEKPGIVSSFLDILAENKINILFSESVTHQQERVHFISVIADMRSYRGDDTTYRRIANYRLSTLENLYNKIGISTIDSVLMENGKPSISIKRMHNYYEAFLQFNEIPTFMFNPTILEVKRNGRIHIGEPLLIDKIKEQIWGRNAGEQRGRAQLKKVILNTHTEDRYISVQFPNPNVNIVELTIVHKEKIGALNIIARVIKELNLNILSSFNRLQNMGVEAHWNLILEIGDNDLKIIKKKIVDETHRIERNLILRIDEQEMIEFGKSFVV